MRKLGCPLGSHLQGMIVHYDYLLTDNYLNILLLSWRIVEEF